MRLPAQAALARSGLAPIVLAPNPSYPIHTFGFIIAGASIRSVPTTPDERYWDSLEKAMSFTVPRPTVLIVNYPSNPTAETVDLAEAWDVALTLVAAADLPKAKITRVRIYRPPNYNPLFNTSFNAQLTQPLLRGFPEPRDEQLPREAGEAIGALASRIATRSRLRVVVPTWSDGRDLLRSVHFARKSAVHQPDELAVVGYGAAGIAALSLALHQRRLGIGIARVTCVDGGDSLADPISGQRLPAPGERPEPVTTAIDVVETGHGWARITVEQWQAAGWAAHLVPAAQFTWRVSPSQ